jgi:WD40 repeat protein
VDALCVNPASEKEFATASHDKTIKIWDAPAYKCRMTLKGHDKGIWSLVYDTQGKRLVSSSPDSFVKIWDAKSGKCAETLKGHNHFCYKACFDYSGTHVVSVGADHLLNYWDLRKTQSPVFSNNGKYFCAFIFDRIQKCFDVLRCDAERRSHHYYLD